VYPQLWDVVNLFAILDTQWRVSPGGISGLDYTAVKTVLEIHGIESAQWKSFFEDIRVMEIEALAITHQQ